jgi:hypothetical protein
MDKPYSSIAPALGYGWLQTQEYACDEASMTSARMRQSERDAALYPQNEQYTYLPQEFAAQNTGYPYQNINAASINGLTTFAEYAAESPYEPEESYSSPEKPNKGTLDSIYAQMEENPFAATHQPESSQFRHLHSHLNENQSEAPTFFEAHASQYRYPGLHKSISDTLLNPLLTEVMQPIADTSNESMNYYPSALTNMIHQYTAEVEESESESSIRPTNPTTSLQLLYHDAGNKFLPPATETQFESESLGFGFAGMVAAAAHTAIPPNMTGVNKVLSKKCTIFFILYFADL